MLAPLALAVLGSAAVAQVEQAPKAVPCPHTGVHLVQAEFRSNNVVACGSGVELSIAGIRYRSPAGTCALLVVYRPAYWSPHSQPNSNTFAAFQAFQPETIFRFQCRTVYLFGFIPVDGDCLALDPVRGGLHPNYVVHPCGG